VGRWQKPDLATEPGTTRLVQTASEAAHRLPVPSPEELSETEADLRDRVLPETSGQEVQKAVDEIPADLEKVKLAAFLTDTLKRATSISPTPWAVFVATFWLALKMNQDVVGALALAFAVMATVKPPD
jgi:hypothetical protein